jgi:phenol hydroxylase P0 protein
MAHNLLNLTEIHRSSFLGGFMNSSDSLDISKRYVRVIQRREDGFIEFHFAIGHTEYFAELMLKEKDFLAFCSENNVEFLPEGEQKAENAFDWTMRNVGKGDKVSDVFDQ